MSDTTRSTPSNESSLICRKPLGEVALRVINGETFCEQDTANVITYTLIGAACKRQMDIAIHAMSHRKRNLEGLYAELTNLFKKYGLVERIE